MGGGSNKKLLYNIYMVKKQSNKPITLEQWADHFLDEARKETLISNDVKKMFYAKKW
jgi:hypothetical protein